MLCIYKDHGCTNETHFSFIWKEMKELLLEAQKLMAKMHESGPPIKTELVWKMADIKWKLG